MNNYIILYVDVLICSKFIPTSKLSLRNNSIHIIYSYYYKNQFRRKSNFVIFRIEIYINLFRLKLYLVSCVTNML